MNETQPLPSTADPAEFNDNNSPRLTGPTDIGNPEPKPSPSPLAASQPPVLSTVLGTAETLSATEQARYDACEAVVAEGWQHFIEVGLALAEIRRDRLYRVEFDTFEDYCRAKWHFSRAYAANLISAAQLISHLSTNCLQKPTHESQVRPLIGLNAEEAQLAWTCAVEMAGGRKITARLVKGAVQQLQLGAPATPVTRPTRQTKAESRRVINATIGEVLMLLSRKAAYQVITEKIEALQRQIQPLFAT